MVCRRQVVTPHRWSRPWVALVAGHRRPHRYDCHPRHPHIKWRGRGASSQRRMSVHAKSVRRQRRHAPRSARTWATMHISWRRGRRSSAGGSAMLLGMLPQSMVMVMRALMACISRRCRPSLACLYQLLLYQLLLCPLLLPHVRRAVPSNARDQRMHNYGRPSSLSSQFLCLPARLA